MVTVLFSSGETIEVDVDVNEWSAPALLDQYVAPPFSWLQGTTGMLIVSTEAQTHREQPNHAATMLVDAVVYGVAAWIPQATRTQMHDQDNMNVVATERPASTPDRSTNDEGHAATETRVSPSAAPIGFAEKHADPRDVLRMSPDVLMRRDNTYVYLHQDPSHLAAVRNRTAHAMTRHHHAPPGGDIF